MPLENVADPADVAGRNWVRNYAAPGLPDQMGQAAPNLVARPDPPVGQMVTRFGVPVQATQAEAEEAAVMQAAERVIPQDWLHPDVVTTTVDWRRLGKTLLSLGAGLVGLGLCATRNGRVAGASGAGLLAALAAGMRAGPGLCLGRRLLGLMGISKISVRFRGFIETEPAEGDLIDKRGVVERRVEMFPARLHMAEVELEHTLGKRVAVVCPAMINALMSAAPSATYVRMNGRAWLKRERALNLSANAPMVLDDSWLVAVILSEAQERRMAPYLERPLN